MTNQSAKKTQPKTRTKKSLFGLSTKDLKAVHGGRGIVQTGRVNP